MCVLSHFRTCDVRAEVRAEMVWNCACGSECVWATFKVRCAIALFSLSAAFSAYILLIILDLRAVMSRSVATTTATAACARYITFRFQVWYIIIVQFTMYYIVLVRSSQFNDTLLLRNLLIWLANY